MSRRLPAVTLAVVALVVVGTVPGFAVAETTDSGDSPAPDGRIVAVYPNPTLDGDVGEFVVVSLPAAGNWTLSDGETEVRLRNVSGRVVVTDAPAEARAEPGTVVVADFSLSNAGERLVLRLDGRDVDDVRYGRAPEGERYVAADGAWRPVWYDPRAPVDAGPADVRAFVLPDAPGVVSEALAGADERILLAGYTLTSERVADALLAAADRGVDVRVVVEASPVGGVTDRQVRTLDRLVAGGVDVRALGGPEARFDFHHAKYAVVDDSALVLTENWKPAGVGGKSSRGWGVRVDSARTAAALADLFAADAAAPDARPWEQVREDVRPVAGHPKNRTYPSRIASESVHAESVRVLTAPGNARESLVAAVDAADERVLVVQPSVDTDGALFRAAVRAAERGVRVRVLLSGAWYAREENERVVADVAALAERQGLDVEARIARPGGRFEKIHAKGVVADDTAFVGSMNWNPTSSGENREVVVALSGGEPATYFAAAFDADWRAGHGWGMTVPPELAVVAVGVVAAAVLYARRRVRFAG